MKKLVALLLVLCLTAFGAVALAEDITLTEDDAKVPEIDAAVPSLAPSTIQSYALDGYSVTNDNEKYTVSTGTLTFTVDIAAYPAVVAMTRDYMASFKAWMSFDYDGVQEFLEQSNSHILLYDLETDNQTILRTVEGDDMARHIGSFTELSDANKAIMAKANSGVETIYTIGNCDWFRVGADSLATIVGGEYVFMIYGTADDATDEDFADSCDFLSTLVIE